MQIKIHDSYRIIVALADTDLIGKTFEQDNKQIKVKEDFFQGEEKNKQETIKILKEMEKEDATFNIVGKESVESALEAGVIQEHGILKIQDVPIALALF